MLKPMENTVGDILHCEEQLRTTLHCDDKEKLRRKLLLLQREYLRTAQRLQRAERSEAVRRHVRSRITHQQNRQDQGDPEVTWNPCDNPSSLTLSTTNGKPSGVPQCQEHTGGPTDSENSRRSQVIRFLLPPDAACPQTPDPIHDAARGHRPSSALRLRSRRSRLRWETRSAEAGRSTDNSDKDLEPNERIETAITERSDEEVKTGGTEVANDSEELFSGTDSESSSLVLTHWNTCGQTNKGAMEKPFINGGQEQRKKETELTTEGKKELDSLSLLLKCNPATHTEGRGQDTQNGRKEKEGIEEGEDSQRQRDGGLFEDGGGTDQKTKQQTEREKSHNNAVEKKENKSEMIRGEHDVKGVGLLDSCTLVEGLLFPAEYYVRTTRRMTSSQSQPDMQAVILSQLSTGRHRRRRGRGRKLDKHTHDRETSNQHSPTDFSSLTTEPAAVGRGIGSQESSSEISAQVSACPLIETDACFSPSVVTPRPARGRRRRGRGRPQTPRCCLSLDTCQLSFGQTSDDPRPDSSPVSSSPSLHGADGPMACLGPGEAAPGPDDLQPASVHTASQPSSGGAGGHSGSAPGQHVYPVFLKSGDRTNRSTQMSSPASWQSLLLPSSPPAQTSLLRLPSLSLSPRVNSLINLDIPQDFHLPDDQFASLKLHKLRQATAEIGLEHFMSPSYNTHRTIRHYESYQGSCDPTTPFPLPLNLAPTSSASASPTEAEQSSTQSVDLQNRLIEKLTGASTSQSLSEVLPDRKTPREQQTENLRPESQAHTASTESMVQECAADGVAQCKDTDSQSNFLPSNQSIRPSVTPQPHTNSADRPAGKEDDCVISQSDERRVISSEQTHCPLEDYRSTEDQTIITDRKPPKEPSNTCAAALGCNDNEPPRESPVQHQNVKYSTKESKKRSEPTISPARDSNNQDKCPAHHGVHSHLLLSPSQASAPFTTSHQRSSASLSSPTLPSVGLTPHPIPTALPLTSSPSAPALNLPPPHSPSTQALSPPVLSPCPSLTSLPPSQCPASPTGRIQASDEPSPRAEPAAAPAASRIQSEGSGGPLGLSTAETATTDANIMRSMHTLKSPAGGCLVDACCLPGSSGSLCVAAAGKWAVCLWSQTAASDWILVHTWSFTEPVINVFPVPDAAGLMCVTLGQLEIREVRTLSCSSLLQVLLCDGLVQAVVGVSNSRVVASSHSALGSTLQVFTLSDSGSTLSSQALVSPGVCVGALAAVDGVPDALIGTDEDGHLFIWNLTTGQLLRRIHLGDDLSHAACLRGYSYCGVLFVLLQHQLLSSLEEEEREAAEEDQMFSEEEVEERKQTALFSLVAVNPLTGKAVSATRLYPPKVWSGRLCEADVSDCSVVGLSQSGCVCVWELGRRGSSTPVWAPESEGWQVARWGTGGRLVTGHHNGDVTLHCYSTSQTPLCR